MHASRRILSLATTLAMAALFATASGLFAQNQAADNKGLSEVVNANNAFAVDFYKTLNKSGAGKNIFVSPYSISTALAMTFEGSRNNTQKQMATVLHFDFSDTVRQEGYSALLAQTKAGPGKHYKLDVANALWGQKDYHFEPAFTGAIAKFYGGGFYTVDYKGNKSGTIERINKWVEDKTARKILNLIHDDDVSELTRLVLTNAIYFKGNWASQFSKGATADAPFYLAGGAKVQVPMMHQTGRLRYVHENGAAAIELPYAGDELSMIAILPDADVDKFGETLSLGEIDQLRSHMRSREVDVFLPRFKFETRYLLQDALTAMGMPEAFDQYLADFSGMTGNKALYIFRVIHQAMIDVNEEGSEAAAATAVVMNEKSVQMDMKAAFRADRPFLFLIVHNSTRSILFMGRLSSPPK